MRWAEIPKRVGFPTGHGWLFWRGLQPSLGLIGIGSAQVYGGAADLAMCAGQGKADAWLA